MDISILPDEITQERPLRILVVAQHDRFGHVLSATMRGWGYEVAILPLSECIHEQSIEADILLYDLDEVFRLSSLIEERRDHGTFPSLPWLAADFARSCDEIWPKVRFCIAMSSLEISRTLLERLGVVACLQKPFAMSLLQRYVCVLRRLLQGDVRTRHTVSPHRRILVVDDHPDVADAVRHCLLYGTGYEVHIAHNGLEALEQYIDWSPHCIVTDLIMPWMNGYQVMRCLSASEVAFVVMSALLP